MPTDPKITTLIPHRAPFLWVDRIIEAKQDWLVTEKDIPADLDVFQGHYPDRPILPGVLLCEAVFQTGALLIAEMNTGKTSTSDSLPVITKISNARFKRPVLPGDTLRIEVKLLESVSIAHMFKGKVQVGEKTVLRIEFTATSAAKK